MTYSIHNIRASSHTETESADTLAEAKEIAHRMATEEAEYYGDKPVWCDADAWQTEPGLEPVGGYDFGEGGSGDAVIIYRAES